MNAATPVIRHPGEGEQLRFAGGGVFTFKATSGDTAGAFIVFEHRSSRGKATPLHVHANEDEAIYVLEGELRVHLAGVEHRLGSRSFFFVPRGVPHAFLVTSEHAHLLCVQTPASIEGFYRKASDPIGTSDEAEGPQDLMRLREAARGDDSITLLGPPPFAS
jgi:quercetin dioxygenase-like cupin family protein